MRELKFRAWDGRNMRPWGFLAEGSFTGPPSESGGLAYPQMQFTGLTDKNGQEIFEGDIVQNQAFAKREARRTKYGEYRLFIGKHSDHFIKGWMPDTVWEVIGNIMENPELLEKSKELL